MDTNSNPDVADHAIPGNDDSAKSIEIIVKHIAGAVEAGLADRKKDKEKDDKKAEKAEAPKEDTTKAEAEKA